MKLFERWTQNQIRLHIFLDNLIIVACLIWLFKKFVLNDRICFKFVTFLKHFLSLLNLSF